MLLTDTHGQVQIITGKHLNQDLAQSVSAQNICWGPLSATITLNFMSISV